MNRDEELNNRVIQMQLLDAGMRSLEERQQMIIERVEELARARSSLDELKDIKTSKIFLPLGGGAFVKGTVESSNEIMMAIGGGAVVKNTLEGAKENLDEREGEMKKALDEVLEQKKAIVEQFSKLQAEAEEISRKK